MTSQNQIPEFPGIVVDPASSRKCALQADIFRGLGLNGNQVKASLPRIYQGRFVDIADVLNSRKKVRRRGRPCCD